MRLSSNGLIEKSIVAKPAGSFRERLMQSCPVSNLTEEEQRYGYG
jgi:hypothetical protein